MTELSSSSKRCHDDILVAFVVIITHFFHQQKPPRDEWGSPLEAMEEALKLEKQVNATLLELHAISADRSDPQVCTFFLHCLDVCTFR